MTVTIYHFGRSRALRPIWLMEELGQPYEVKEIPMAEVKEYGQSDEYKAIHPLGKFPAMIDGDVTLIESIAIMEYLMNKYDASSLRPAPDSQDYPAYLQWLQYGEAGMGMYVIMLLAHTFLLPERLRNPHMAKWGKEETNKCLAVLVPTLEKQDYLCASGFSAADISVGYMLFLLKTIKQFDDAPEAVKAYWERLKSRPAWQRASGLI